MPMPPDRPPDEPFNTRLLRLLWQAGGRRNGLDALLTRRLSRYRLALPQLPPEVAIPEFMTTEVRLARPPVGGWSTPLADVFVILKTALGCGSRRILEIGSFRGDTSRILAENTPVDARVWAVDIDPRHGESYRDSPPAVAGKITRLTGAFTDALLPAGERFDLIFLDAGHDYASVRQDTELAFARLSDHGVLLWHDYRAGCYFAGGDHVADVLRAFSPRHALAALTGTTLAIHSRHPGWETARLVAERAEAAAGGDANVWASKSVRG